MWDNVLLKKNKFALIVKENGLTLFVVIIWQIVGWFYCKYKFTEKKIQIVLNSFTYANILIRIVRWLSVINQGYRYTADKSTILGTGIPNGLLNNISREALRNFYCFYVNHNISKWLPKLSQNYAVIMYYIVRFRIVPYSQHQIHKSWILSKLLKSNLESQL